MPKAMMLDRSIVTRCRTACCLNTSVRVLPTSKCRDEP
jgi:hypothetical protein